jgi:nitrogen regulatory protein PII
MYEVMATRKITPKPTAGTSTLWASCQKSKIEAVLPDYIVEDAIDAIVKTAFTGAIGDGKIFLSKIDHAVRIRNQQIGAAAL